jgi:hypothetical protein
MSKKEEWYENYEHKKCKCGHQRMSHYCAHYFGEDHYGRCRFCECERFEEEEGKTQ